MNANLLIVSAEDIPNPLFLHLENSGYSCHYSRGVLKTRETLKKQQIDAIVWLFLGHELALARDLARVFNQHSDIPIVFITQHYEELDFAEDIKALFANLDLNDDLHDIVNTIETACNQSIIKENLSFAETGTHEIEFRNIVSQIIRKPKGTDGLKASASQEKLQEVALWEAVDKDEKQILAGKVTPLEKKSLLPKIKTILKKS